jgi:hypothetical protein
MTPNDMVVSFDAREFLIGAVARIAGLLGDILDEERSALSHRNDQMDSIANKLDELVRICDKGEWG